MSFGEWENVIDFDSVDNATIETTREEDDRFDTLDNIPTTISGYPTIESPYLRRRTGGFSIDRLLNTMISSPNRQPEILNSISTFIENRERIIAKRKRSFKRDREERRFQNISNASAGIYNSRTTGLSSTTRERPLKRQRSVARQERTVVNVDTYIPSPYTSNRNDTITEWDLLEEEPIDVDYETALNRPFKRRRYVYGKYIFSLSFIFIRKPLFIMVSSQRSLVNSSHLFVIKK